jgi:hypothetical protein
MAGNIVDFWFYVNAETEEIEKVYNVFPLGVLIRENGDWTGVRVDDSGIRDMDGYKVYQLNWNKIEELADEEFDPLVLKKFDSGELTLEELLKVADLRYDSTDKE